MRKETGHAVAGASAGLVVDIVFYPLDTHKTRLQATTRSLSRNWYAGLTSVLVGSAPSAGLFFVTYERCKQLLPSTAWGHMVAASCGEVVACLVRVPTEVVKQRTQTGQHPTPLTCMRAVYSQVGMRGFYHGFGMTILRDVPFAALQFALYEHLKRRVALYTDQPTSKPWQAAVCASIAGATAGALTTPLDVLKTRVMTTHNLAHNISLTQHLKSIHQQHGLKGLLSGIIPRTLWISFGGFVFLGVYEHTLSLL